MSVITNINYKLSGPRDEVIRRLIPSIYELDMQIDLFKAEKNEKIIKEKVADISKEELIKILCDSEYASIDIHLRQEHHLRNIETNFAISAYIHKDSIAIWIDHFRLTQSRNSSFHQFFQTLHKAIKDNVTHADIRSDMTIFYEGNLDPKFMKILKSYIDFGSLAAQKEIQQTTYE